MEDQECETGKPIVRTAGRNQEFEVEGFDEALQAYIRSQPSNDSGADVFGWLLLILGGGIAIIGLLTLIFGPETVTYRVLTGPTFFQYIQMYPGMVFSVGAALFSIGGSLARAKLPVTPEQFLLDTYSLVQPDGSPLKGSYDICHLGEDRFFLEQQLTLDKANNLSPDS